MCLFVCVHTHSSICAKHVSLNVIVPHSVRRASVELMLSLRRLHNSCSQLHVAVCVCCVISCVLLLLPVLCVCALVVTRSILHACACSDLQPHTEHDITTSVGLCVCCLFVSHNARIRTCACNSSSVCCCDSLCHGTELDCRLFQCLTRRDPAAAHRT